MQVEQAISAFLSGYFATCRRSDKTVTAYATDLSQFSRAVGATTELGRVGSRCLERWAASLHSAGYASASIRRKFAAVRVFFRYWVRQGRLSGSPLSQVRLDLAPPQVLPRVLAMADVRAILALGERRVSEAQRPCATVRAVRDRAIAELLFASGMRIGELAALDVHDYFPVDGVVRIMGKGARERCALLPDAISRTALDHHLSLRHTLNTAERALFLNYRGARLSAQGAANIVTGLATCAGVHGRVTPHMFRHTVATQLLERGADIRVVQVFLGHSSITTTQRYTHVSRRHLFASLTAFHPNTHGLGRKPTLLDNAQT